MGLINMGGISSPKLYGEGKYVAQYCDPALNLAVNNGTDKKIYPVQLPRENSKREVMISSFPENKFGVYISLSGGNIKTETSIVWGSHFNARVEKKYNKENNKYTYKLTNPFLFNKIGSSELSDGDKKTIADIIDRIPGPITLEHSEILKTVKASLKK